MLSLTKLQTMFGKYTQNSSTDNINLATDLMNIEQRYLLQKYFSNENSYTFTTIGANTLTMTAAPILGATSATLTSAWTYPTCNTIVTFSDGEQRLALFTLNSTTVTWQNGLIGTQFFLTAALAASATSATLSSLWTYPSGSYLTQFSDGEQKTITFTLNSTAITWSGGLTGAVNTPIFTSINTTALAVGGVQSYRLPPDYSKLKTGTLTIGNLTWTPTEVLTREEWDRLNVFPYYADIPSHFFIWKNQFQLWPIPSTTGNIITFNYKKRIPDLSLADYSTGTVSVNAGSTAVTGSGTAFVPTVSTNNESRWIQFAQPKGDNLWYQIQSVDTTTGITLYDPYYGTVNISGGAYTIGQMPILIEDFHDMLLWKALVYYFSSIVENEGKAKQFQILYDEKLELLSEYAGTKTVRINLSKRTYAQNPNIYPQSIG